MNIDLLRAAIDGYIKDKTWYWYIPFWLLGFYMFIELLEFKLGSSSAFIIAIPQSFNFFLHEMSHLVFGFLPPIFTAAAGSFSEIFLGLALIITAVVTRGYFASLFCVLWFMLATQSTADYIGDARAQNLSLVSFGGGDPIHDWNFILNKLGLLQQDTFIAGIVSGFGIICGIGALGFSGWLIIRMFLAQRTQSEQTRKNELMNEIIKNRPQDRPNEPFTTDTLYPTASRGPLAKHDTELDRPEKSSTP